MLIIPATDLWIKFNYFFFFRGPQAARVRGYRGYQVLRIEKVPMDTMEMFNQLVEGIFAISLMLHIILWEKYQRPVC
jgi:hypothetical protein